MIGIIIERKDTFIHGNIIFCRNFFIERLIIDLMKYKRIIKFIVCMLIAMIYVMIGEYPNRNDMKDKMKFNVKTDDMQS